MDVFTLNKVLPLIFTAKHGLFSLKLHKKHLYQFIKFVNFTVNSFIVLSAVNSLKRAFFKQNFLINLQVSSAS
jgi:hypothetical protein